MSDAAWWPDRDSARAVLIGAGSFRSADLHPIPAVGDNLADLSRALTDPDHGVLDARHCRVIRDPATPGEVGAAIAEAAAEASGLLLVYYAGHGLIDDDGLLRLSVHGTSPVRPEWTAIPLSLLRRDLGKAGAAARVLLLDCCFSGRAVSATPAPPSLVAGQLTISGTFTLTSTAATAPSHAPEGSRNTAFTAALLEALAAPQPLTLEEIHRHIDLDLAGRGLPRPYRRAVDAAGSIALARRPTPPPRVPAPHPKARTARGGIAVTTALAERLNPYPPLPAAAAPSSEVRPVGPDSGEPEAATTDDHDTARRPTSRSGFQGRSWARRAAGVLLPAVVLAPVLFTFGRVEHVISTVPALDFVTGDRPNAEGCSTLLCSGGPGAVHSWSLRSYSTVTTTFTVAAEQTRLTGALVRDTESCPSAVLGWTLHVDRRFVAAGVLDAATPGHVLREHVEPGARQVTLTVSRGNDGDPCAVTFSWSPTFA